MKIAIIGATGAIGQAMRNQCCLKKIKHISLFEKNQKNLPKDSLFHVMECGMEVMDRFNEKKIPKIDIFFLRME